MTLRLPPDRRRPFLCLFSFDLLDEGRGIRDLDAIVVFEVSEMGISGDNVIRLGFQGSGQELVVCRIVHDDFDFVDILGNDRLSEDQTKKAPDGFIRGIKSFPDPWVVQDAAQFPDDLNGCHQHKVLGDPKILKLSRERILAEKPTYEKVCVDNRPEFMPQLIFPFRCFLPLHPEPPHLQSGRSLRLSSFRLLYENRRPRFASLLTRRDQSVQA